MPLAALAAPIAAGVGAALGTAIGSKIVDSASDYFTGNADQKQQDKDAKALAKIQKSRAAKEKKREADAARAAAKAEQQAARDAAKQQRDEVAAARKVRASIAKDQAAAARAEKQAIANDQRTQLLQERDAIKADREEQRRQTALAKIDEKQTETQADAKIKADEAALKDAQKKWAADDSFLQGQKVVVSNPNPPPGPLNLPPAPGGLVQKRGESDGAFAKRKAKADADYKAETTKLVLGGIGSGGKGTLDWLAQNAPGAVEARQAHNDAIDRELEKRKKEEEAAVKKVSDEKEAESKRRADWQKDQVNKSSKTPPVDNRQAKRSADYQKTFPSLTKGQADEFARADYANQGVQL